MDAPFALANRRWVLTLKHLNSTQKGYFWGSLLWAVFGFLAMTLEGRARIVGLSLATLQAAAAVAIYRNWRHAHWVYFVAWLFLAIGLAVRAARTGLSTRQVVLAAIALLAVTYGARDLGRAMRRGTTAPDDDDNENDNLDRDDDALGDDPGPSHRPK